MTEQVERRKFLKYAGSSAVLGAAIAGVGVYALEGGVRDQVTSLSKQVAGLQAANTGLQGQVKTAQDQITAAAAQNRQLQLNSGVVGYAFGGGGRVAVIDMANQKLISTTVVDALAKFPGLSWADSRPDSQGRAWAGAASSGNAQAVVFDPVTNSVVGTVPLPGRWWISLSEIDPRGKFFYILNLLEADPSVSDADLVTSNVDISNVIPSHVYKIDTATLQVVDSVLVGRFGCDVTMSPDGKFLYVPDQLDQYATVIDLSTFKPAATVPFTGTGPQVGASMLSASPDGAYVFLENFPSHNWSKVNVTGNNSEVIIDAKTNKVIKEIPLDEGPGTDEFSPDGKYSIVNSRTKVTIIDVKSLSVVQTIKLNGPSTPAFSPDSKYALVAVSKDKIIQVIDMSNFDTSRTIPLPSGVSSIIPYDPKGLLGYKLQPALAH